MQDPERKELESEIVAAVLSHDVPIPVLRRMQRAVAGIAPAPKGVVDAAVMQALIDGLAYGTGIVQINRVDPDQFLNGHKEDQANG